MLPGGLDWRRSDNIQSGKKILLLFTIRADTQILINIISTDLTGNHPESHNTSYTRRTEITDSSCRKC